MLRIKWRRGQSDDIDLAGGVATGGPILAGFKNSNVFRKATVADYGAAVAWDDDDDLRIDAVHLEQLAPSLGVEPISRGRHRGTDGRAAA